MGRTVAPQDCGSWLMSDAWVQPTCQQQARVRLPMSLIGAANYADRIGRTGNVCRCNPAL
jgi:hypothetical protein